MKIKYKSKLKTIQQLSIEAIDEFGNKGEMRIGHYFDLNCVLLLLQILLLLKQFIVSTPQIVHFVVEDWSVYFIVDVLYQEAVLCINEAINADVSVYLA